MRAHTRMHRLPTPPRGTATTPGNAAWSGQHTLLDGVLVLTCTPRATATARLALVDTPHPRSSLHVRPCSEASTSAASHATIATTRAQHRSSVCCSRCRGASCQRVRRRRQLAAPPPRARCVRHTGTRAPTRAMGTMLRGAVGVFAHCCRAVPTFSVLSPRQGTRVTLSCQRVRRRFLRSPR